MTEPYVQPMKYMVNSVPETVMSHYHWALYVEYRGEGKWVVTDGLSPSRLLGRDGKWTYQPSTPDQQLTDEEFVYYRDIADEWKEQHRYSLREAMDIARLEAPKRTVNGYTVEQAIERFTR